jgi:hypothetical protein
MMPHKLTAITAAMILANTVPERRVEHSPKKATPSKDRNKVKAARNQRKKP